MWCACGTFLIAHLQCTDTFIAVSRPDIAGETIAAEWVSPFPTWCGGKFSIALAYGAARTVLHAISTPGYRNKCIRDCPKAPLKKESPGGGDSMRLGVVEKEIS